MTNMIDSTGVCANTPPINKQTNHHLYKAGYIELSSYCKGIEPSLSRIISMLNIGNLNKVRDCINSMRVGLVFVLEDIEDIERELKRLVLNKEKQDDK